MAHIEQKHYSTRGHNDILDISADVAKVIAAAGINEGICVISVGHSTCAITTIEYEDGLVEDIQEALERLFPSDLEYRHNERWGDGNGHAHVRSAFLGPSLALPVREGKVLTGAWQQIVLIDFDNRPRERSVTILVQ